MAPRRFPKTSKFWEVYKLQDVLMNLAVEDTTLSTSKLKNMGIERAPDLDIDNPDAVDAYPVFFQPFPDTAEYRKSLAESRRVLEEDGYRWSRCTHERSHIGRLDCVGRIIDWLTELGDGAVHVHHLYPTDIPQWRTVTPGQGVRLPEWSAKSVYLKKHRSAPPRELPEWFTSSAFYIPGNMIKESGMRHVGLFLVDTTSHKSKPDEALRSEITAGVSFIKRRMVATHDTHSTIPIIIYSFYHNETARITQMCWNGEQKPITFRQSRLVDISSESLDTPDVAILLRWMDCIPLREPRVVRRRAVAEAGGTNLQPRRPTTPDQGGTPQSGTDPSHHTTPTATHAMRTGSPTSPTSPMTPTPTRTQNGPGIASGHNKTPPRSGTPTPTQRPPSATTTTTTPPRSGTPTPPQRPPSASSNNPTPRSGTPTNAQRPPHATPTPTTTPTGTTTTTITTPTGTTTTTGADNTHPRPPAQGSTPPRQGTPTGNGSGGGGHTAVPRQTPPQTPGRDGAAAAAGPSPPRNNNAPSGLGQSANLPIRNAANGNGNGNHGDGNGHGNGNGNGNGNGHGNGNGNADGSRTQQPGGLGPRH